MTDVDTVELKPCPFCGSDNVQAGGDDKVVGVWCHNCGATGPNGYLTINGDFEWNTRSIAALPPAVPKCIHMTAEMAQNCPICNPSPNARASDLGSFLPQCGEVSGPALGVELSDSSAQGATTPDPVAEAAKVLLADDIALSRMSEAMHDGPLGADEHWFSAATEAGGWCLDCVRAALRALIKDGEAN